MSTNHPFKAALLSCALLVSASAFAGDTSLVLKACEFLPLVNTLITPGNPENKSVCVDVPVNLDKVKTVFNLDSIVTDDGTPTGLPVGLRHMWMLGNVVKDRIAHHQINAVDVSIIGLLHGAGATWALNDAWWQGRKNAAGDQLFPNGNPNKAWIERLFALQKAGVNIQLEVCGATMFGAHWTNADLYNSPNGLIHVNQGAIGRLVDLEQNGYAYIQEGFNMPKPAQK